MTKTPCQCRIQTIPAHLDPHLKSLTFQLKKGFGSSLMRLKLSKSFIFLIGSVLLAGISALLYFDYRTNSILLEEVGLGQAAKLANAISDQLHTSMRLGGGRHENRAIIERFKNIDGIEDIRIIHGPSVDRQYGVELDEVPTDALDMKALEGAPASSVARSQNGYMVARNVMPSFFEKSCLGCHVGRPGDVAGAVSVSVSMKEYERIVAGHSVKFFIGGGGILIVTSLVVLMLVHRRLLEPLEKLRDGALELARGRFEHRVGIRSGDEFEELGDAFDSMAASLSAASEDLSELGGKYSRLVDMAADAILLRDIETGLYAESNQAASVLSGYTRDELMKMCPADLFPLSKLSEYNQAVLRWVHDEKGFLHDAMVIKKEGFLVPVEISASLIEIKGRKFIQEIWRDVSERKGLEETIRRQIGVLEETVRVRTSELNSSLKELEEAYRRLKSSEQKLIQSAKLISLGEMGAGIAHELNSPLAGHTEHNRGASFKDAERRQELLPLREGQGRGGEVEVHHTRHADLLEAVEGRVCPHIPERVHTGDPYHIHIRDKDEINRDLRVL